jgi:hypothetical protein
MMTWAGMWRPVFYLIVQRLGKLLGIPKKLETKDFWTFQGLQTNCKRELQGIEP